MKSKDLVLIFLVTSIYIFIMTYPHHLSFNRSILEFVDIVLLVLFSGYSLISFLRPKKNNVNILKKPLLVLGSSLFLMIITGIILNFSSIGLHLKSLTLFLSLITMILLLMAYFRRIIYFNSSDYKKIEKSTKKLIKKQPVNENAVIIADDIGMEFKLSNRIVFDMMTGYAGYVNFKYFSLTGETGLYFKF